MIGFLFDNVHKYATTKKKKKTFSFSFLSSCPQLASLSTLLAKAGDDGVKPGRNIDYFPTHHDS
jgi:hypothetical protein